MVLESKNIISKLNAASGKLEAATADLVDGWLSPLFEQLDEIQLGNIPQPKRKQVTDPIWHIIDLEGHEVLFIDSPIMQRLRGIRQLGLAHLVFPGATHDRFAHSLGVLAAVSEIYLAINKVTYNNEDTQPTPPKFNAKHLHLIRFAALLHDIGHGPFSHAVEPLLERQYEQEVKSFTSTLQNSFNFDSRPAFAEIISALIIFSPAMAKLFNHSKFSLLTKCGIDNVADLQLRLAMMILGARNSAYPVALSSIISGQIDGDKLDYMTRDAYHSGMPISFDTRRLMSRIDHIRCDLDSLPEGDEGNRAFAEKCMDGRYYDIGIKSSGVGALEQMLIGRNFLYDRLYFHHKVRAADAMAQRLLEFALPEVEKVPLKEIYLSVNDDTIIALAGGELRGKGNFVEDKASSKYIANALSMRKLYQRAFLFRARLHHLHDVETDETFARVWSPLSSDLATRQGRENLEKAIIDLAEKISQSNIDDIELKQLCSKLKPWHIIVDLAANRIKPVSIHVTNQNGQLALPNLTFDPTRWAEVYNLQKRTGYVFCPEKYIGIVALLSRIAFCKEYKYVSNSEAEDLIKVHTQVDINKERMKQLLHHKIIDQMTYDLLSFEQIARPSLDMKKVQLPKEWKKEDCEKFSARICGELKTILPYGLADDELTAIEKTIEGMTRYLQTDLTNPSLPRDKKPSEPKELQKALRTCFDTLGIPVTEGAEMSGGETDLIIFEKALIENKVVDETDSPLAKEFIPNVSAQAQRYAESIGTKVFFTMIAYKPKADNIAPITRRIKVIKREFENAGVYAEIRCAVPYGRSAPSRAKLM